MEAMYFRRNSHVQLLRFGLKNVQFSISQCSCIFCFQKQISFNSILLDTVDKYVYAQFINLEIVQAIKQKNENFETLS